MPHYIRANTAGGTYIGLGLSWTLAPDQVRVFCDLSEDRADFKQQTHEK